MAGAIIDGSRIRLPTHEDYKIEYETDSIMDDNNFVGIIRPKVTLLGVKIDMSKSKEIIENALGKMFRDELGRYASLKRKGTIL